VKGISGIVMMLAAVLAGVLAWNTLDVALGGPGVAARGLIPVPVKVSVPRGATAVVPAVSEPSVQMPVPETAAETFAQRAQRAARYAAVYEINGILYVVYFLLDNIAAVVMLALAGAAAYIERDAPAAHRVFTGAALLTSVLAALSVPSPVPVVLAVMWVFVPVIPVLDPAGGRALSWRAKSGILLYAGACTLYLIYSRLTAGVSPEAWAALAGGVEEARAVMAQSRAYVTTMANIALWFVMPVAYLSLMVQALLAHPFPTAPFRSVAERIRLIRTRGVE